MNDKIREVALRVAREIDPDERYFPYRNDLPDFLTRCLQELSKDVEPVAIRKWSEIDDDYVYSNDIDFPTYQDFGWEPVYLHPPLTEQDKRDAERYRAIRDGVAYIEPGNGCVYVATTDFGLYCKTANEFDEAIDRAMENEK